MKFKTGDKVIVIAGKDKGKTSKIIKVFRDENKVIAEGVNVIKRHVRAMGERPASIVEIPAKIDASNLAILDPKTKKPSRIAYKFDKKGKKIRIAQKTGATLD